MLLIYCLILKKMSPHFRRYIHSSMPQRRGRGHLPKDRYFSCGKVSPVCPSLSGTANTPKSVHGQFGHRRPWIVWGSSATISSILSIIWIGIAQKTVRRWASSPSKSLVLVFEQVAVLRARIAAWDKILRYTVRNSMGVKSTLLVYVANLLSHLEKNEPSF